MNHDFPRLLTLLRKEKGLSQKQVSTDLNISQALLSHYEKGVRECGLEFIVKVSDYYGVSCDYLLGKTPNKDGVRLNTEEIPDSTQEKDNRFKGSVIATLNKKLIVNSISIIFDLLQKIIIVSCCFTKFFIAHVPGGFHYLACSFQFYRRPIHTHCLFLPVTRFATNPFRSLSLA